jgi:glycosyltransferase A (GT-A) superfamily protein (DUF2064 family)
MAEEPRPGTVKTRLHPLLGPARCAESQAGLIRHALETVASLGLRTHLAYAAGGGPAAARVPAPPAVRPHTRPFGLDPAWGSTDEVPAATLALAADRGPCTGLIPPLRDPGTSEDAAALLRDPLPPPRIAALLRPEENT